MRYLVGFVFVLALVSAPLAVSAQAGEEGATPEPNLEEPAPSAEPAPEEPALQLKLDDAGVDVVRSPPPAIDGYPRRIQIIDEPRSRGAKAGIAVGVILGAFIVGSVIAGAVVLQF